MRELRQLSAVLAKKAEVDLNETPENVAHKLTAFKEWLNLQTHMRARTNDQFLIVFLRGAKFNLEVAKQKLENYYISKTKIPEMFVDRNPCDPKVLSIIKQGCVYYLPKPAAPDGPTIGVMRPNRFDMSKHTVEDVFMVGSMATEILLLENDNASVAGYVMIMDLRNVSMDVVYNFNPVFIRKVISLANKASPIRMKGYHFINPPTVFAKFFSLVKTAISEKLRDRVHMHEGGLETLYKYVPREVLPKEYGGEIDEDEAIQLWWQKIQTHAGYLKDEENYGIIGNKNEDACRKDIYDAEFGIDGSFRKLSID